MWKIQDKAYWLELVRQIKVEELTPDVYADGLVEFGYISLKKELRKILKGGIETTEKLNVLETRADLPFKKGDKIRIGASTTWQDNWYKVVSVDYVIENGKESVIALFPKLRSKYEIKRIVIV